jgi:hypothetical protein
MMNTMINTLPNFLLQPKDYVCVAAIDVFAVGFFFIFGGISCRWTRSNWAFLNFPPEMLLQDSRDRYTPQFDVAAKASNLNQMYSGSSSFSTTL